MRICCRSGKSLTTHNNIDKFITVKWRIVIQKITYKQKALSKNKLLVLVMRSVPSCAEHLTDNAKIATVMGSIPTSSDTLEFLMVRYGMFISIFTRNIHFSLLFSYRFKWATLTTTIRCFIDWIHTNSFYKNSFSENSFRCTCKGVTKNEQWWQLYSI